VLRPGQRVLQRPLLSDGLELQQHQGLLQARHVLRNGSLPFREVLLCRQDLLSGRHRMPTHLRHERIRVLLQLRISKMCMPGFTAERALSRIRTPRGLTLEPDQGEKIIPQLNGECDPCCNTNRSCWGLVLGCRDHCTRAQGASFSSLWYVCGVCIGLFTESIEIEF
jgi:hypothetical protein